MIISKDLFIFGEQIFASIIPEGVIQQQQQQQQQQQNQLNTTNTNTSGAVTASATEQQQQQQVVVDPLNIKNLNKPKTQSQSPSPSTLIKKSTTTTTTTKSLAKQEIVNSGDTVVATTAASRLPNVATATPDATINLVTQPSNDIVRPKEKSSSTITTTTTTTTTTPRRAREGQTSIKVSGNQEAITQAPFKESRHHNDNIGPAVSDRKLDEPDEKEPLVGERCGKAKIIITKSAADEQRGNSLSQHQQQRQQRQQQQQQSVGANTILEKTTKTTTSDFTLNMGKVNLGNNNATRADHAMVTIPFINEQSHSLQLSFQNINVLHNERQILADVSGLVSPGEVLAIMGPSGSGKTTLLDCLSGQRRIDSGSIHLNREPVSKKWRRKICYVLQEEIFFAGLTLRETVMYTALLRLPEKMPKAEKIKQVDRLLEELELNFCQQTKFGDYLNRGLSGGEKKRANIACELLTNPLLMLLDEPTSGLDSHSAISLMKILKRYAMQEQKTVVITVHQPSSQMFHMFDKLLLLYNGRTAYFGEVHNIYRYFEDIGVAIKPHYNPADFVLEQLKSFPDIREKLFAAAKESHHNFLNRNCIALKVKEDSSSANGPVMPSNVNTKLHPSHDNLINDIIKNYYKDIDSSHLGNDTMLMMCGADSQSTFSSASSEYQQYDSVGDWLDYPTRFHTQFRVLSSRNFKEAKPRMLSKLNWFQTIGLALMAGAIWFQIPRTEEFLHDLQGWMFFSQTYWMLFALFGALNSFPSEREVISKERRSGAYRLSAYYLAKMFGELPLVVTLPTVYLMISYPMLGCTSCKLFFLMLVFLLLNTIVAQSVGFFIGACCMDMNVSITLSALYTLATQLFGGYLSSRIPDGLSWIRYTSMIHYAYQNMQILEFREGTPISCGNPSSYEICKNAASTATSFIPYEEILRAQNSTSPLWLNTCVLMMFFVVFRSLGYAVLRYLRCPKT